MSILSPGLRVAGGSALLVRVSVLCPTGLSVAAENYNGQFSVSQKISRAVTQTGQAPGGLSGGVRCDGKRRVITVPVAPDLGTGTTGRTLAWAWSFQNAAISITLDYCSTAGTCAGVASSRKIAVRNATSSESAGFTDLPSASARLALVATRSSDRTAVELHTVYRCLPQRQQDNLFLFATVTQRLAKPVNRVNRGDTSAFGVSGVTCDGKPHPVTVGVTSGTTRGWQAGAAYAWVYQAYCPPAFDQPCTVPSVWSPIRVK